MRVAFKINVPPIAIGNNLVSLTVPCAFTTTGRKIENKINSIIATSVVADFHEVSTGYSLLIYYFPLITYIPGDQVWTRGIGSARWIACMFLR